MSFDMNPADEDPHGECRHWIQRLEALVATMREKIEQIVVTGGCDRGVVLLSSDGPTHYDAEVKCQVYDHENFSPLGDALIELYELTTVGNPKRCDKCNDALTGHEPDSATLCCWCVTSSPTPDGSKPATK